MAKTTVKTGKIEVNPSFLSVGNHSDVHSKTVPTFARPVFIFTPAGFTFTLTTPTFAAIVFLFTSTVPMFALIGNNEKSNAILKNVFVMKKRRERNTRRKCAKQQKKRN
jgi:hypothetical protein